VVWFRNDSLSPELLEWALDPGHGSLATLLRRRLLDLPIYVRERDSRVPIDGALSCDALPGLRAAFLVSHAGRDWSVRERSTMTVVEGLERLLERGSGERVWAAGRDLRGETQIGLSAEQAICGASCVVVCLSRAYLADPDCLRELCWAVQEGEAGGRPLVLVSVDPGVSPQSLASWPPGEDLVAQAVPDHRDQPAAVAVHHRTVAFAQRHLRRFKMYLEWQQGEGAAGAAQGRAVDEMLASLRRHRRERAAEEGDETPRAAGRAAGRLEVRRDEARGGSWWYVHEEGH
jgi:hypothetical protein